MLYTRTIMLQNEGILLFFVIIIYNCICWKMGDNTVKLLMFSDIEGCQKFNLEGANKGTFEQSGFLCNPKFYTEMRRRLDSDPNLNIAFLGDYFDQGMGVYESIKGMDGLLTDYNKDGKSNKDGKDKVFVILGNRDVNKLRFCYELANKDTVIGIPSNQQRWGMWNKFHDNLGNKTNDEVALVNHILFESMGAKIDMNSHGTNSEPDAKLIGLHSFLPSSLSDEKKQDSQLALKYLKVSLGIIPKDEDMQYALDLLGFFSKCKLAHVFDGPGGKVLLAHGGGFDSDAFFDQPYVYSFEKTEEVTGKNYHTMLEEFRRKLSVSVQSGGDPEAGNRYGNDQSKRNKYGRKLVPYSVDVYNTLLEEVLKEIRLKKFTWRFVLLQALGLKPDREDARYKSLIQSCSQDGCSGPNPYLSTDKDGTKLANILKDSGITHVSYGHKPICFPIPVIYKRKEIGGVTFISNDTSNGNRKVDEVGENTAIGTMVIFDSPKVKSKIEPIELILKDGKVVREGKVKNYSPMFEPLTYDTTPEYIQKPVNVLTYKGPDEKSKTVDKEVVFNYKGFGQLLYVGGKRRSRHRKQQKSKRGSKYGGSKKTRRSKQKHTKRGRKMRKQ
jgi:hypothetical protein